MSEYRVRFIHVTSEDSLAYVRKDRETDEQFLYKSVRFAKKVARNQLLLELYKGKDIPFKVVTDFNFDVNVFRRYTYVITFPYASSGDFETVAVAFSRQANGDQFCKAFGRDVSLTRLVLLLDGDRKPKYRRDHGFFAFEVSVDNLANGVDGVFVPEKVMGTILSTQRSLKGEKRIIK